MLLFLRVDVGIDPYGLHCVIPSEVEGSSRARSARPYGFLLPFSL